MSPVLVLAIVVAVVLIAVGLQVTSRQLQRFGVDSRQPGPLIDTTRRDRWVVRPLELDQLNLVVAESLSSQAVARSKLEPILDRLEAAAPPSPTVDRPTAAGAVVDGGAGGRLQTRRRSRSRRLDDRLARLELAWGLAGPAPTESEVAARARR